VLNDEIFSWSSVSSSKLDRIDTYPATCNTRLFVVQATVEVVSTLY
jgi:hypothetical protein